MADENLSDAEITAQWNQKGKQALDRDRSGYKKDNFVDNFLSAFSGNGPARANRYKIEFSMPQGIPVSGVFTNTNSETGSIQQFNSRMNGRGQISTLCHTCTLPSREIQASTIGQWGPPYRVPTTSMYQPVAFSFYTGSDFGVREYFEVWQTAVCNISSNTFNFYNEFTSDIRISVLDTYNEEGYRVDLIECWPSSVGTIDLSYSNTDNLANVTVVMQYKYWRNSRDDTRIGRSGTAGPGAGSSY